MVTKVIFRVWNNGFQTAHFIANISNVIALFPEEASTVGHPEFCQSYEHVGQHGAASPLLTHGHTRPATQEEYEPLKRELESLGYKLKVMARMSRRAYQVRRQQLEAQSAKVPN